MQSPLRILLLGFPGDTAVLSQVHIDKPWQAPLLYAIYTLALGVSLSIWFLPIYAPLWLDETVSFFIIKGRFSEILLRQGWPSVPAFPALLWLWVRATGTGEVTLRLFSVAAMLAATYLLYRAARELFDRDVALIAAVVFCLHPVVIFAAVDIRPYPFAALAITASIFVLLRLRRSKSFWLAALFGFLAATIVYFQFLFIVIVPALAVGLLTLKAEDRKTYWRRVGISLTVFALAFLPVIPGVRYMFHTSATHVFADAPHWQDLAQTLAQRRMLYPLLAVVVLALITRTFDLRTRLAVWPVLVCASLALIPILILYGVSLKTSLHIFVFRYRLVAVPGIALCWALVLSRIHARALRAIFCVAVVAVGAYLYYRAPDSSTHDYTWKYALDVVEKNASVDNAPVLMCSDLPESDYLPLPTGVAVKDSALYAPLSYYQLSVPVIALPRSLNAEAMRIGTQFLHQAGQPHRRFLAMAFMPAYETLDWLEDHADDTHTFREIGTYSGITVVEFSPRNP